MSDRSYVQLMVVSCPPEQRAALDAAATGLGFTSDVFAHPDGDQWTIEECPLCEVGAEFAPALVAAAPQARWRAWQDPRYEVPGSLAAYDGAGTVFTADCDAQGQPYLTAAQVDAILRDTSDRGTDPAPALRQALGLTHATATS